MGYLLLYLCLHLLCLARAQENQPLIQRDITDNNINGDTRPDRYSVFQENHKPLFDKCAGYNPSVKEDQPAGTFVINVHAVDQDDVTSAAGKISYTIEEPNGLRPNFRIDNGTGDVFTNLPFDRDDPIRQKALYLTVRAVDHGWPPLADICTFKVTVTDINDNVPIIDQQDYQTQVSEDHRINSEVLRVTAFDYDDGDNARLTYSLSNSGNTNPNNNIEEFFRIEPSTGVIYLKQKLTDKSGTKFQGIIKVQDNGMEPKSSTVDVSFTVVDSDKKAPTLNIDKKVITVKENLQPGHDELLPTFRAESNLPNVNVVWDIIKGKTTQTNKEPTFALNSTGKQANLQLIRNLDYETVTEYQLTISAENADSLRANAVIIVQVEDVNDETPVFIEVLKGSIVENNEIGAPAMTVRAVDKDATSPNNLVKYELLSHQDLFSIDPDSGLITAKAVFDREQENIYHVTVQANDSAESVFYPGRPNSAHQSFQISIEDQNDNPPKFRESIYVVFNISESANEQKDVIEVHADDKDTASQIHYSIIDGNTGDAFYIEETTGRIKVKNKLDFEKIESYNLTVRAFDGIYNDSTEVRIHILNENDEPPVFEAYANTTSCKEETIPTNCIFTLKAYDPDIKDRSAPQNIVYTVQNSSQSYLSVDSEGCGRLKAKLDRDPPNGRSYYQAFIYANDNNLGPNTLRSSVEIDIILEDINDNAPVLNMTEVVWYENETPGLILTLNATDNDAPENGPPFRFEISDTGGDIYDKFRIDGSELYAQVVFDREEQKYYNVPIKITDAGDPPMSGISTLKVIIGDRNDNPAADGSSEIFVYNYKGFKMESTKIGRVYVTDPDDWDLPDKTFLATDIPHEYFTLNPNGGMIEMRTQTPAGVYKITSTVRENLLDGTSHDVKGEVTVTVKEIPEEAVRKSGSIRLSKSTIEEFIEKNPSSHLSKKDVLQDFLSKILNTSLENVDVFTVMTSPSNSSFVDVRFSAHGSPYYEPERLNNKAAEKQSELEDDLGVKFEMISINDCLNNPCEMNESCSNILSIKDEPAVVFTNQTSFVGVKAVAEAQCICAKRMSHPCLNGGSLVEDKCDCPEGAEGPNCEILGATFLGDGWAMYPTFDSCSSNFISLDVLPQADDGLIFYAGPLTERQARLSKDFISLELRNGDVVLKITNGEEVDEIISNYKKINDGAIHKIKINYTFFDVQIEVDECPSECLKWKNLQRNGSLKINGPLQVGGRSGIFSEEAAKGVWNNPPGSQGFKGCITNFTYNSFLYSLGTPSDKYNARGGTCNYATFQAATFGIDSNFLVAILVCLAILLILLLAVVVHKRKQDNFNEKDMDDTRENIINYEDEGGGECDTNFDLTVFPPKEKPPMKDNFYKHAPEVPGDIDSFLNDKKRSCDKDTLPYDDVRYYAYEGDGNSSGSLSSLASCTDEGDLKFNYLSNFGPRFRKLADMYGDDASEEGSQNGEESWC